MQWVVLAGLSKGAYGSDFGGSQPLVEGENCSEKNALTVISGVDTDPHFRPVVVSFQPSRA